MNILLFSHEYPPCIGGAGSIAESIFTSIKSRNIKIQLLTSSRTNNDSSNFVFTENIHHKLWFFSYAYWINKNIDKFDVIICNDPAAIYNAGKYFSKELLLKTVCLIHGEEKYLNSKSYLIKKINFSNHFKRALNDCKKVIFVSDYIKNRYKYLYDIIIDENRVKVIHSGVNNSLFKKIVKAKNNDNNSFLTVSRIEKAKGFDVMLHSLCKVKESGLNFHWYIAGDGSYFEKFKENVSNSTLNKNITFLGRVERSCLPEIYSLADYYISLSELNESYGLSYLEAASCGVKPIGYNRCGTAEAFKYIHNGVLIESFKDINEISETLCNLLANTQYEAIICTRTETDFINELIENVL